MQALPRFTCTVVHTLARAPFSPELMSFEHHMEKHAFTFITSIFPIYVSFHGVTIDSVSNLKCNYSHLFFSAVVKNLSHLSHFSYLSQSKAILESTNPRERTLVTRDVVRILLELWGEMGRDKAPNVVARHVGKLKNRLVKEMK